MWEIFALGSLVGASGLNLLCSLPSLNFTRVSCAVILCITFALLLCPVPRYFKNCTLFFLAVIIGLGYGVLNSYSRLLPTQALPLNEPIQIQGVVQGMATVSQYGTQVTVKIDTINQQSYPSIFAKLYCPKSSPELLDGDKLIAKAKLKLPIALSNPGGFDQEKKNFIDKIQLAGKIIHIVELHTKRELSVTRLRAYLLKKMKTLLEGHEMLGVLEAMLLGWQKDISPMQWQLFRATGTSHLVAISGAHIGFVAALCYGLARKVFSRFYRLTLWIPAQCLASGFAFLSAIAYSALAGFSLPTRRACIMILVAMLAVMTRRAVASWRVLSLAWLGVFILDPFAPMQVGFWLSFGCVAALIYGLNHQPNFSKWRQMWQAQQVVFIALIPLSLYFFGQLSLIAPLANLLALPLVSFVIVPFGLFAIIVLPFSQTLAQWLLLSMDFLLQVLIFILKYLASVPFAFWQSRPISFLTLSLGLLAVCLLLNSHFGIKRHVAWLLFIPCLYSKSLSIPYGECRFTLLDVGQGLSAMVQTQHHSLLYDAGPQYNQDSDAGTRVIEPFLYHQQIKQIDKLVISHGDLDHQGGLRSLKTSYFKDVVSGEPQRLKLAAQRCQVGERWQWDGVDFEFLSPHETHKRANDNSCVLKVTVGPQSIMLTGDISKKVENYLVKKQSDKLASTILIAPHHGSLSSSSEKFVRLVKPEYALFAAGYSNKFNFPKEAVLARFSQISAINLISWQSGALIFHLNGTNHLTPPIRWRETSQHYWSVLTSWRE